MNMLNITVSVLALTLVASAVAEDFTDTAQVISSTPNYREVSSPRQECWTEAVPSSYSPYQERSYAGAIIGGIAGAIIGNRVGGGRGKEAATGLGAAIGALTGDRLGNGAPQQPAYATQQVQRCQAVNDTRQVNSGYNVVYRYAGRDVMVTLPYDPGDTVTVGVGVLRGR
jgi:uncharacterized protein YcfJ